MGLAKWHKAGPLSVLVMILVVGLMSPVGATVSGDNGKIAFVTDRDGNREIYSMDADGSNQINLTSTPEAEDYDPAWSPDGRRIAFVSDRAGNPEIYVMGNDGSNLTRLTNDPGDDWEPAWSPDGTRVAFGGEGGIYLIGADGSNRRRITDPGAVKPPLGITSVYDEYPAWSPDGARIAFVRHYQSPSAWGHYDELMVMAVDAASAPVALPSQAWRLSRPDWAPDGSTIVLVESERVGLNEVQTQTVLVDTDGSGGRSVVSGLNWVFEVAWSPDGSRFAGSNGDIHVIGTNGFDLGNLTNNPAHDGDPAWQPLNPYAVGLVDTATGIWRLRHESGAVDTFYYGNPGDTPFMGDWDCDGVDTPGLYRRSDGFVYLRNSNTQGVADTRFFFGNPGDMPIAGDFDGDGCDTVSIYRPSDARFHIINELGSEDTGLGYAEYSFIFGNPGDKPFVGDFDGDSIDEVGLHRESTGRVYFRNTLTQGAADADFIYGNPGDRIMSGDWNDNGTDSPALFRPTNTTFYFRFTNTQGVADAHFIWGNSAWLPVSGDFTP